MESRRPHRVADLLLHEIAWVLQREIKDPRIGFVTLTAVEMNPDLKVARVYYTVLGEQAQVEDTARGLESARSYIRRSVGKRLHLRAVPEIRFLYDASVERGLRTQMIIERITDEPEEPDR